MCVCTPARVCAQTCCCDCEITAEVKLLQEHLIFMVAHADVTTEVKSPSNFSALNMVVMLRRELAPVFTVVIDRAIGIRRFLGLLSVSD